MLAIKLQRIGRKHQPSYRLVVSEKRSKMAGPPVEDLGSYHPATKSATFNKERISYWLGVGAQPTVTTHNLLVAQGILSVPKIATKMKKPAVAEATPAAAPTEVSAEPAATVAEPTATAAETPATAPVETPETEQPAA
jgi:small subunit ribosomal protein S16